MAAEATKAAAASVKETLLGSDVVPDVQVTAQSRATFEQYARSDAESGEAYMNEEDFVNAVAPVGEDYVSYALPSV